MIYKLLGLVLMTPVIALIITVLWYAHEKQGWTSQECVASYMAVNTLMIIFEIFILGLYFLFK